MPRSSSFSSPLAGALYTGPPCLPLAGGEESFVGRSPGIESCVGQLLHKLCAASPRIHGMRKPWRKLLLLYCFCSGIMLCPLGWQLALDMNKNIMI
ncbi:unnamed protein product [Prunus brigantina]